MGKQSQARARYLVSWFQMLRHIDLTYSMITQPDKVFTPQNIPPNGLILDPSWNSRAENIMSRVHSQTPLACESILVNENVRVLPLVMRKIRNDFGD